MTRGQLMCARGDGAVSDCALSDCVMQRRDGFWYYWYRVPGGQYAIFARCRPFVSQKVPSHRPHNCRLPHLYCIWQTALLYAS